MRATRHPVFDDPMTAFRAVLDGIPAGICLFDEDRIVYFNRLFADLTGITETGPSTRNLDVLFEKTPHGPAYARGILDKIRDGTLDEHVWDNPISNPDGRDLILRGHVRRIKIGSLPAILVTLRDITAQRKAEKR